MQGMLKPGFLHVAQKGSRRNAILVALQAVTALSCMEHRGACSADEISGDGAGIMTQIPWELFKQELPDLNEQDTG